MRTREPYPTGTEVGANCPKGRRDDAVLAPGGDGRAAEGRPGAGEPRRLLTGRAEDALPRPAASSATAHDEQAGA